MNERTQKKRRRRRRPRSLLGYLLPIPAVMLIGIMLAAALSPSAPRTDASTDTQTEQLAGQLADSIPPDISYAPPVQKPAPELAD